VFPLVFAAIVGRTVKAYTTWRLEGGETLGNLDTIAGSATLISTIMSQMLLRIFALLGFAPAVAWMLSPWEVRRHYALSLWQKLRLMAKLHICIRMTATRAILLVRSSSPEIQLQKRDWPKLSIHRV
jgi:hypothetical protein